MIFKGEKIRNVTQISVPHMLFTDHDTIKKNHSLLLGAEIHIFPKKIVRHNLVKTSKYNIHIVRVIFRR